MFERLKLAHLCGKITCHDVWRRAAGGAVADTVADLLRGLYCLVKAHGIVGLFCNYIEMNEEERVFQME